MAVSGSKNFAITRADIIEGALRKSGAYDQGESISGDETHAANMALNLIFTLLHLLGFLAVEKHPCGQQRHDDNADVRIKNGTVVVLLDRRF